jgi:hypothetical protein
MQQLRRRGRPKGTPSYNSKKNQSFGPLGDLIRSNRLAKGLGLADLAEACHCSVQFISNIEHGRAPLPWEKVPSLAKSLQITEAQVEAANLAVRSDFKNFVSSQKPARGTGGQAKSKNAKGASAKTSAKNPRAEVLRYGRVGMASMIAVASRDPELSSLLERLHTASPEARAKFLKAAQQILN